MVVGLLLVIILVAILCIPGVARTFGRVLGAVFILLRNYYLDKATPRP